MAATASLTQMPRRMVRQSCSTSRGRNWWRLGGPAARPGRLSYGTQGDLQLKVHRQIVQSVPLDDADIECLIQGLRLVTPCTQRIDRLIDLLEQIRGGGRQDARPR
jgi:hypothetical protein